jgi:hypothetical protein
VTNPLPRPPRHVPWRVALRSWGRFGTFACAMLATSLLGLLVFWAQDDFRSPRDDWRLDAAPAPAVANAHITAVQHVRSKDGRRIARSCASYTFLDAAGVERHGRSWLSGSAPEVDAVVGVEYLPDDPGTNRLLGSNSSYLARILPNYAGFLLLPELLLMGLWLTRAYRVRTVLRHGRATTATLVHCRRPDDRRRKRRHYAVRFRYHGNDGTDHEGWQYTSLGTPLDRVLAQAAVNAPLDGAFVVHDEMNAGRARLVTAAEVSEAAQ